MNKSSFIQEDDSSMKKAPTLVRRVSDMFKDGTYSGPPSLFSQKIRHCCQNLNLFPYLLYSFENTKSHPFAKKVNLCFDLILRSIVERILFVYTNLRRAAIRGLQKKSVLPSKKEVKEETSTTTVSNRVSRLTEFQKQKPKQNSILLVMAIYLAPIILMFQLIGLCSLLVIGKYTPGFVFLMVSLLFLGYISGKVMLHEKNIVRRKKHERRQKTKQE